MGTNMGIVTDRECGDLSAQDPLWQRAKGGLLAGGCAPPGSVVGGVLCLRHVCREASAGVQPRGNLGGRLRADGSRTGLDSVCEEQPNQTALDPSAWPRGHMPLQNAGARLPGRLRRRDPAESPLGCIQVVASRGPHNTS